MKNSVIPADPLVVTSNRFRKGVEYRYHPDRGVTSGWAVPVDGLTLAVPIKQDGVYELGKMEADVSMQLGALPVALVVSEAKGFKFDVGFIDEPDALFSGISADKAGEKFDGKDTYAGKRVGGRRVVFKVTGLPEAPKEGEPPAIAQVEISIPVVQLSEVIYMTE